jgi:hypothetical protein
MKNAWRFNSIISYACMMFCLMASSVVTWNVGSGFIEKIPERDAVSNSKSGLCSYNLVFSCCPQWNARIGRTVLKH